MITTFGELPEADKDRIEMNMMTEFEDGCIGIVDMDEHGEIIFNEITQITNDAYFEIKRNW